MAHQTAEEALAAFCAAVPVLRRLLRGPASARRRALLERTLTRARQGEPVDAELAELGFGTTPAGPQTATPTTPVTRDPGSALPTLVAAAGRPVTGVYLCPAGTCDRVEERTPGGPLPACEIHERALRFAPDGPGPAA
jgi:hypothetical protein